MAKHDTPHHIDNTGATIDKQLNIGSIAGNVYMTDAARFHLESRERPYRANQARTYYYGSGLLEFYGRHKERQALAEFIEQTDDKLLLWLMTGDGGVGKSRLAFELCREYRDKGYRAGFLSQNTLLSPNWAPEQPTLIIIDYAAERIDQLKRLIDLYEASASWRFPVRILLLERPASLSEERLKQTHDFDYVTYQLLQYGSALELQPLSKPDLLAIMKYILRRPPARQLPSDKKLWQWLLKVDPKCRSLFAAYLAEALRSQDADAEDLSYESILEHLYIRELKRWQAITGKDLVGPYMHLLYLVTLAGGCDESVLDREDIRAFLPGNDYDSAVYSELISTQPPQPERIAPLEPDIFGEYVLLRVSEDATKRGEKQALATLRGAGWRLPNAQVHNTLIRMQLDFDTRASAFIDQCIKEADLAQPETSQKLASVYRMIGLSRGIMHGDDRSALEAFTEAIRLQPDDPLALFNQGMTLFKLNRLEEAASAFGAAIVRMPEFGRGWFTYGTVLRELGRHDESLAAFDKAIQLESDPHEAWFEKAQVLFDLQQFDDAAAAFGQVTTLRPGHFIATYSKGLSLSHLGKVEQALQVYDEALKIKPQTALIWRDRAVLLAKLDRSGEAMRSFRKALALNPRLTDAWFGIGLLLAEQKKFDKALKAFDKELVCTPDHLSALINKGASLANIGNLREAESYLAQAIQRLVELDATESITMRIATDNLRHIYRTQHLSDEQITKKIEALTSDTI